MRSATNSPSKMADNDENPGASLARVGTAWVAISGLYAQWLRGLTINAHERLAVAHLWQHGPMTMSELGARIPLSRAAITALTDRLEAQGYVERRSDDDDRRRTVLHLTEYPLKLISELAEPFIKTLNEFESTFTKEELDIVARWHAGVFEQAEHYSDQLRKRSDDEV